MASITLTIPTNKLAEAKLGFLKHCPVPTDEEGNPEMSEIDWVKQWFIDQFKSAYKQGKQKIAREAAISIDEGIIN